MSYPQLRNYDYVFFQREQLTAVSCYAQPHLWQSTWNNICHCIRKQIWISTVPVYDSVVTRGIICLLLYKAVPTKCLVKIGMQNVGKYSAKWSAIWKKCFQKKQKSGPTQTRSSKKLMLKVRTCCWRDCGGAIERLQPTCKTTANHHCRAKEKQTGRERTGTLNFLNGNGTCSLMEQRKSSSVEEKGCQLL